MKLESEESLHPTIADVVVCGSYAVSTRPERKEKEQELKEQAQKLNKSFVSNFEKAMIYEEEKFLVTIKKVWIGYRLARTEWFKTFWNSNKANIFAKTCVEAYIFAKTCVRNDVWETDCDIQKPLQTPVFKMVWAAQMKLACHGICEEEVEENAYDYMQQNLAELMSILNMLNMTCTSSVVTYAFLLFKRLRATFPKGDKQMHEWFFNLPAIQIGKILHMLSDLAHRIADTYGVLSIMFAMCLHFAMVQLEDDAPFRTYFFTNMVFWYDESCVVEFGELNKTRRERKRDFILLQRATLIQLNWATHISVKEYTEGVQALEGIDQEEKEKILKMFDNQDQTHAELMLEEPLAEKVDESCLGRWVCIATCGDSRLEMFETELHHEHVH
jgi:hypothetical protein